LLNNLKKKFDEENIKEAISYSLQNEFSELLLANMERYNETKDQLSILIDKLEDTQQIMTENVEKILERGEKLEVLVQKALDMSNLASTISTRAVQLKNRKRWENNKTRLIMLIFFLILAYVLLGLSCGFRLQCF